MSEPTFDIGMNEIITSFEMSLSGDELLMSLPDPGQHFMDIATMSNRFERTTEEDRNKLIEDSECSTAEKATSLEST